MPEGSVDVPDKALAEVKLEREKHQRTQEHLGRTESVSVKLWWNAPNERKPCERRCVRHKQACAA